MGFSFFDQSVQGNFDSESFSHIMVEGYIVQSHVSNVFVGWQFSAAIVSGT
jgi:hypothetical protein